MKTCRKCKQEKSLDDFCNRKKSKDGKDWSCRECQSASNKEYRVRMAALPASDPRKQEYCATKLAAWNRYRAKYPEKIVNARKERDRTKHLARKKVQEGVRRGTIIKPQSCEHCNKLLPPSKLSGHHKDYSKPFDVVWLCSACHGKEHRSDDLTALLAEVKP